MPKTQIMMGAMTAALCMAGCWNARWLAEHTTKGQWFVRRFGQERGLIWLRCVFGCGVLFGLALATNVIHPIRWE